MWEEDVFPPLDVFRVCSLLLHVICHMSEQQHTLISCYMWYWMLVSEHFLGVSVWYWINTWCRNHHPYDEPYIIQKWIISLESTELNPSWAHISEYSGFKNAKTISIILKSHRIYCGLFIYNAYQNIFIWSLFKVWYLFQICHVVQAGSQWCEQQEYSCKSSVGGLEKQAVLFSWATQTHMQ